jgi:hypothetical protein
VNIKFEILKLGFLVKFKGIAEFVGITEFVGIGIIKVL